MWFDIQVVTELVPSDHNGTSSVATCIKRFNLSYLKAEPRKF